MIRPTVTTMRILSLGAGVQSTTIALMMAAGEIEPADRAIFADTKAEPASVYRHLEQLIPKLPFPVDIVSAGDLSEEIIAAARGERSNNNGRPPFYVKNADGSRDILRRQCTGDYKIDPIHKRTRELLGVSRGQRVPAGVKAIHVIGISFDERGRMRDPRKPWLLHDYPLCDRRISRWDCEQWLRRNGHPIPPKSACVFCPYRRVGEWRRLRDEEPEAWAQAVAVDAAIRSIGYRGLVGECYLHDSLVPLEEVDLSTAAERGQTNLWDDECEGMCGV